MLLRTDMSMGISDASPPSLTHGCAKNKKIHTILISRRLEDKNEIMKKNSVKKMLT